MRNKLGQHLRMCTEIMHRAAQKPLRNSRCEMVAAVGAGKRTLALSNSFAGCMTVVYESRTPYVHIPSQYIQTARARPEEESVWGTRLTAREYTAGRAYLRIVVASGTDEMRRIESSAVHLVRSWWPNMAGPGRERVSSGHVQMRPVCQVEQRVVSSTRCPPDDVVFLMHLHDWLGSLR
jgi:hypothetical protein